MDGTMKVHLFKVVRHDNTEPLENLLQRISQDAIEARLRVVGTHDVRIENVTQDRNGNWLLDFGMLRYAHGPGRARRDKPIIGFEFEDGETFGEETAALYNPQSGCMLVQYNHFGVRSGAIQSYLDNYDRGRANAYELAVVFDKETERKLATKNFFSRLSVTMAVSRLSQDDRDAKVSLSDAISIGGKYGARNISFSMSMGPGRNEDGLDSRGIKRALKWVNGILRDGDNAISKAEVVCKENPDGIAEVLDLVKQRLAISVTTPLGADRRFAQEDRWKGLARAHRSWNDIIRDLA